MWKTTKIQIVCNLVCKGLHFSFSFIYLPTSTICRILGYLLYVVLQIGAFLIMSISINRFIVVAYPLQCVTWLTVNKTCSLVAAMVIFGFTYNFYSVFTFQLVDEKTCSNNVTTSTITRVMSLLTILFNSVIPYFVVIVMNILIIRKLKIQSHFRERNATIRWVISVFKF